MTAKRAHLVGWTLIATVTLLSFVLDYFRMLIWHFNWFMAILFIAAIVLVVAIVRLGRLAEDQGAVNKKEKDNYMKQSLLLIVPSMLYRLQNIRTRKQLKLALSTIYRFFLFLAFLFKKANHL